MSYEKVKSIKIDEKQNKVFITSACNNVRPITYDREEFPYFSKILQEKGREGVEIALLKSYEGGSLQEGKNKFSQALKVLRYVFKEEYKKFNWRNHNAEYGSPERDIEESLRESKEFEELLKKCLDYKFQKTKFIITKDHFGEKIYGKRCLTCMKWSRFKEKATKYDFEEEAKNNIFQTYKDVWKIEQI